MDTNTAVGTTYDTHKADNERYGMHTSTDVHSERYDVHTYIDVRNGRTILARSRHSDSCFIEEKALNWHELEPEARSALKNMESSWTSVLYSCPPELARKAIFSDDEEWLTLHEACRVSALSLKDIHSAIKRGRLDVKTDLLTSHADERVLVRRSQVLQVWPLTRQFGRWDRGLRRVAGSLHLGDDMLLKARFWQKVNVGGSEECWLWESGRTSRGYGSFFINGKSQPAHRVAYALAVGPIPEGKCVRHKCGNYLCVNPSHLELTDRLQKSDETIKELSA